MTVPHIMAVSKIPKPAKEVYVVGDYFGSRGWRAMGRVTMNGKGVYCWLNLAYPMAANSAVINIGDIVFYGISNVTYPKTVSSISIVGNELMFTVDLTSTHQAGTLVLMEFNNTSIRLT